MLEVLSHSNLPHQPILVPIHSSQVTNMCKDILQTICQLKCFNITKSILYMRIHNQLNHPQDFTTKMESISKSAFLPFLRGQSLNWLKIEVVVQMQVVEVLSVDQKVKHVVALPTDVETCLNPVEFSQLEELGGLKSFEQISFVLRLWFFVMQRIQNPTLKKLLITHSNFDGVSLRAVFFKPI